MTTNFDYKSNSHKSKEKNYIPEKTIEKIIDGEVKIKKKSELQKLSDVFISEDVRDVKSYVFMDVLVPAIKKAVYDVITNGIDMILYGGNGSVDRKPSTASKVSYRNYFDSPKRTTHLASSGRNTYDYDDIIFDNRGEAEEVLSKMDEIIASYGTASVGDLYDLVGVTGRYTDNNYGWTNLRNAQVMRTRTGGYIIKFPKVLPLDN